MLGKSVPVTGHGDLLDCETSRLPHFLDNLLTDGGEVVSLKGRTPFIAPPPQEDSWYSFLLEAESTPSHSAAGRIRSIEKSNDIENRNCL
jgi:hypothetical protein